MSSPSSATPSPGGPVRLADALRAGPLGAHKIPGSAIGPYLIERELGRGGMGAVLRARHQGTGQAVALKVLLAGSEAGERARKRFVREAKLGEELGEGVIAVLDTGEADGLLFIAFELIEGGTLDEAWEGASPAEVVDLLLPVLRTLARAHARGVVHRDLKPANIMVRAADRQPLLADLGLGRDLATSSSLTKTGALLGTVAYMAPEQIKGQQATPATDVYALGVILYEGLTGEQHLSGNIAQRYAAMLSRAPERPSAKNPAVPAALDAIVLRCLEAKPERRFPDAGALADALQGLRTDAAPRGKRTLPLLAGSGALLLALGVAIGLAVGGGEPAPSAPAAASSDPPAPAGPDPEVTYRARLAQVLLERDPARRLAAAQALRAHHPDRPEGRGLVAAAAPWIRREAQGPWPTPRGTLTEAAVYDPDQRAVLLFGGWQGGEEGSNELWAYADGRWQELVRADIPPRPRWLHACAYDAARSRLVLFSGCQTSSNTLFDLWEWSSREGWSMRGQEAIGPAYRTAHALAYDARREVAVLFGGRTDDRTELGDLWEWSGAGWTKHEPTGGPSARFNHALVYDAANERTLLYGGTSSGTFRDDLWAWDGERWQPLAADGPRPPARTTPALTATDDGRLLLFGGWQGSQPQGDTWVFAQGRWEERLPLEAPAPRRGAALVWDPERKTAVLFGGQRPGHGLRDDVWEYRLDGEPPPAAAPARALPDDSAQVEALARLAPALQQPPGLGQYEAVRAVAQAFPTDPHAAALEADLRPWQRRTFPQDATLPSPRHAHRNTCAYDPHRRRMLVFGGFGGRRLFNELWSYDGDTWTLEPAPGQAPVPRYASSAAFDIRQRRFVLFGGRTARAQSNDLWTWDGVGWTERQPPAPQPSRRGWHAAAYDAHRGLFVVTAGSHGGDPVDDTWEWDGTSWRQGPKGPPARNSHSMTYDPATRRILLLGGSSKTDLWAYDGTWTELHPQGPSPLPRTGPGFVSLMDGRCLLFGPGPGTWLLEPATATQPLRWTERHPAQEPEPSNWHGLVYDSHRRQVVHFGGSRGKRHHNEVWEYAP